MNRIDAALLCAFIEVESNFQKSAFLNDRNGGSFGLTQLDLPTAQWAGFHGKALDLYSPRINIAECVAVLGKLSLSLAGHGAFSLRNLAAAYNAGLQHVLDGGTDKPYEDKIIAAYTYYAGVLGCDIPPLTVAEAST